MHGDELLALVRRIIVHHGLTKKLTKVEQRELLDATAHAELFLRRAI
jgi:hypothetical protein